MAPRTDGKRVGDKHLSPVDWALWNSGQEGRRQRLSVQDENGTCAACVMIRSHNEFSHHDYKGLVESARRGCGPCGTFLAPVSKLGANLDTAIDVKVARERAKIFVALQPASAWLAFDLFPGGNIPSPSYSFAQRPERLEAQISQSFGSHFRDIPLLATSNLPLMETWVDACVNSHPQCRAANPLPRTPTRLLEIRVASVSLQYQDVEKTPHIPKYAALSYCWGKEESVKTTTANLQDRQNGIQIALLPQTIQDAVVVCKALRIEFLWVDSLCIIQDSKEDWDREISLMGDYYGGSYLTISALGASGTSRGFLGERRAVQSSLLFRDAPVSNHDGRPPLMIRHSPQAQHKALREQPLSRRGWALQERILATRILHFSENEMFWECSTCSAREGCIEIDEAKLDSSEVVDSGGADFKRAISTAGKDHYSIKDGAFALWYRMVREFSRRSLSKPDDRLPAIASLAVTLSNMTGSKYQAGVFLDDICGLAWSHGVWPSHLERAYAEPLLLTSQPSQPSWSWGSFAGPVDYELYDQTPTHSHLQAVVTGFDESRGHGCLEIRAKIQHLRSWASGGPHKELWTTNSEERRVHARVCTLTETSCERVALVRLCDRQRRTLSHPHRRGSEKHGFKRCDCSGPVDERLTYFLVVAPDADEQDCWRRVGLVVSYLALTCPNREYYMEFDDAPWENIKLT